MAGNWITTTSFATGRFTNGGNFTAVSGAYIYLIGGCTAFNASGYCTTVASDIQLASINADGSLDSWATNGFKASPAIAQDARMGGNVVAWRGAIYEVGGCNTQDPTLGACTSTLSSIYYGTINQDGDASTVAQSSTSGTGTCSGASPYNCDLPSTVGNVLNASAVLNGFLYIMGGCSNNACSTTSNKIEYQAIASDGSLQKPAACTGTYTDSYCISSTNMITGLGAAGVAVFNGRIYLVGGFNTGINIYYISVNTDGSIASYTQNANNINNLTSGATNHITTLTYAYAYARANPSSAGSVPGNLFIFGGCMDGAVGCSTFSGSVYKCDITTTGSIAAASCTDSGQLQIGTIPTQTLIVGGTPTNFTPTGPGLGAMAGAVYANYIYLIGGLAPGVNDMDTVRYAKFDNSNNVVAASGSAWVEGANKTSTGRRRGAGFGYNGYIYVVGGYDGTTTGTTLNDIEFAKINVSDGSWGSFTNSSVTINQRWGLSVPVSNSYAYVIGGCTVGDPPGNCTTRTRNIQTFQIYNNDSGTPAAFTTTSSCGTGPCTAASGGVDRIGGSSTILNGYIYYAGGCSDAACTTPVGNTYYAPVSASDGSIGAWASGNALPSSAARAWGKLLAAGGSLYYVGGQSGSATTTAQSTVYYANSFSSGNPTWATATNGLPAARTQFGAAVWNNRLYIAGGYDSGGAVSAIVYSSPQQSSGGDITGSWTTNATSPSNTSFSVARAGLSVTAYANNLYVLGGYDGTNYLNDVQYAQISTSNGTVGSWTYTTSLPSASRDGEAFAANGYMYIVGGRNTATTCRPVTLAAPISANTTIATGNNPTGVGEWYETNAKYTGDRFGAATAYSSGKLYVIGGSCNGSFVTSTNRMYYTGLLSQPQIAQYSIMFDNDGDVYPSKWLLNGLDNSVGAYWNLSYRSMSTSSNCDASPMTTWGQTTTVNPVTLGTPGTYTAYNSSGTNIHCAQYYFLMVSIDASQAFGYPEDISRGPTIADLTLQFTANPSKRLMHGRTFTGGLQQPDDTPF
jgi:hypothetical protein